MILRMFLRWLRMSKRPEPSEMSDEDLAEDYKSYFLQMENDLPRFTDEPRYFMNLAFEVESREYLEVLKSVRVIDNDSEEVLAE